MRPMHEQEALGAAVEIAIPEAHRAEGHEYTIAMQYHTDPEVPHGPTALQGALSAAAGALM